ncbi:MDR family MFS transporter [Myxococcaceae bacterium GXIMD 01537]
MHSAAQFTRQQKAFTLLGVMLGLLLAALDQTIVATAGPAIQESLRIPASLYPWITTAYLVASTMMVPVYGKLSDLFGRKPILVFSIVTFLAGSFLCGVSNTTLHLILARAVQGLGSAGLFTSAFAVAADLFPPAVRGKYQGLFGAVFGLSSVVGPLVGGFITDAFGWHWVFFINLPLGALALAFIFLRMPTLRPSTSERPRLDVGGALALVFTVVPLLLALSLGRSRAIPGEPGFAWGSWQILGLFLLSAASLAAFIAIERRAPEPLLDPSLFHLRTFALGNAVVFIIGASFLAAVVFLPLFMVNVVGLTATNSGLTITPLTLGVVAGNVLSGQLVSRLGRYKGLMLGSLLLLAAGFAVVGFTLTPESTQLEVTLKMILVGVGLGPSIPLYTVAIQNAVPPQQLGVTTAAITFFRQLGVTVGVTVLGTVFAATLTRELASRVPPAAADLPSTVRAQVLPANGGGPPTAEGAPLGALFEAQEAQEQLRASFDAERRAPGADRARLDAEEQRALAAVDRVDHAIKQSFTRAISVLYRVCVLIALVSFLLTLPLPEKPLRRTHGPAPQAEPG